MGGSLFVLGTLGARAGAGMKRGTSGAVNGQEEELLPTFRYASTCHTSFMRVYLRRLREHDCQLPITDAHVSGAYHRYTGDVTTLGKGEILIYAEH
jgi:formylmethanofuran dehydrogenase subunit C